MGVLLSTMGQGTGRTDDPDPVTGLTSRDKHLVNSSWANVRKNPTENGVALLNLLFEKHPEYQQLFPFKDVPLKELPHQKRYQVHCRAVVYGLNSIVDALDDAELLVAILQKVGESHVSRRVTTQAMLNLKTVTIELFSTFMKKNEIEAWKKTLDVAFAQIIKGLES